MSETLHEVEDDDVENTLDSNFKKTSFTRRFRRRLKRFIKRRKVRKAEQEIVELQKFTMICAIGNPALPISKADKWIKLFMMMTQEAWQLFVKIGGLIIRYFTQYSKVLVKIAMKHPYFITFATFSSSILLILDYNYKQFGKRMWWHDRLIIIILSLGAIWLLSILMEAEAFNTILEWLKSILIRIIWTLRYFNNIIDSSFNSSIKSQTQDLANTPKPSKAKDFKEFAFFSVLTALIARYFFERFKRKLVGEGHFTDEIIKLIEFDIDYYLPKLSRSS